MICEESLTHLSLKACVWDGFGTELLITDSIPDHFEGLGTLIVRGSP